MVSSESVESLVAAVSRVIAAGGTPAAENSGARERPDVLALGVLADEARRARHGQSATFLRVHDIGLATPSAVGGTVRGGRRGAARRTPGHDRRWQPTPCRRARGALPAATLVRGFWLADLETLGAEAFAALQAAGLDEVA